MGSKKSAAAIEIEISELELKDFSVDDITNKVVEIMASEFDKNLTVNEKMLQEQALHFVSMVNKLDTEKELFREQALKFIDFQGNPESTNYMKDKEDAFERSINQQKYLLAINFEHYLSIYRKEKERSAIYVTVDSKGHIAGSYEIPMKELITYSLIKIWDINNFII